MFSIKKFLIVVLTSFIFLSLLSTQWIAFDYPTAPFWQVTYWKLSDQLFRVNSYGAVFSFISATIGLSLALNWKEIISHLRKK